VLSKAIRSKAMARTAVMGLSLGVTALASLAGYSITLNADTTSHIRTAAVQSDKWGQVTLNISNEYEVLNDYLRASSQVGRQPLLSAMGSAEANLAWLVQHGDADDRAQAADVAETYGDYTETLRALVAADNEGDRESVESYAQQVNLAASVLRKTGIAEGARKRLEQDQYLSTADEHNQELRVAAGAIIGFDLLLLLFFALVMIGHQRRIERQAKESAHRAGHDGLTGLANRSSFHEGMAKALHRAEGAGESVGVLILDLNNFKQVNDTLGHHAGDLLLTEVATRLADAVRLSDTAARLGGDEFAVLLPAIGSIDDCLDLANRLLDAVQGPADLDGVPVDISGSIGAAVYPMQGADAAELLKHADIAMYAAKRTRSGTAAYDAEADSRPTQQLGTITAAMPDGGIASCR
jgi:diguanylate cyclase (GGDEF)-like protein